MNNVCPIRLGANRRRRARRQNQKGPQLAAPFDYSREWLFSAESLRREVEDDYVGPPRAGQRPPSEVHRTMECSGERCIATPVNRDRVTEIVARTAKTLGPERRAGGRVLCRDNIPRAARRGQ